MTRWPPPPPASVDGEVDRPIVSTSAMLGEALLEVRIIPGSGMGVSLEGTGGVVSFTGGGAADAGIPVVSDGKVGSSSVACSSGAVKARFSPFFLFLSRLAFLSADDLLFFLSVRFDDDAAGPVVSSLGENDD